MSVKPEGYCHICGKYGKLSFEHIPPQKALNNNKALVYTGENAIKRYKGENAKNGTRADAKLKNHIISIMWQNN